MKKEYIPYLNYYKKSRKEYLDLIRYYEDLLWFNNVRAAIYTPNMRCSKAAKGIFTPNSAWHMVTGTTQLNDKVRITPLYFNHKFLGFIALKINCEHFDSIVEEMRKDIIRTYIQFYYRNKFVASRI